MRVGRMRGRIVGDLDVLDREHVPSLPNESIAKRHCPFGDRYQLEAGSFQCAAAL